MCEFARPVLLVLALAVPALVWWRLRRRTSALRYPSTGLFAGLPPGKSRLARWGSAGLRTMGLLLLVVALAGPRWPDLHTRIPVEGIAIEMVVDVSGSMAEPDFHWQGTPISRLEAAKRAFHLFVEGGDGPDNQHLPGRPQDLIGLVTFATWAESPCPLTLSHSVLVKVLDDEAPRTLPTESRTNIGDAIAWGLHRLESAKARRRVMVLLSDGEHNVPPPALTPRQAAQLAANQQIAIYAIDAGGDADTSGEPAGSLTLPSPRGGEGRVRGKEEGGLTPSQLRASGRQTLQAVAQITGGRYFEARDTASLLDACQQIDRLEKQKIESFQYRRYYEGFTWLGLASFVLLMGVWALEKTIWLKIP